MNMHIKTLIEHLQEIYNGDPWYGENISIKLDQLTAEQADWHPHPDANSIAQILKHMISWKKLVIGRVKNNDSHDIEMNSAEDWDKNFKVQNEVGLKHLIAEFKATQAELIEALQNKTDEYLQTDVTGRSYKMGYLVNGIYEHNIYHLGQVGYVQGLWKRAKE